MNRACSLVGAGAGLGWLVLVFCERKTLLTGWFGLAETNKRTGWIYISISFICPITQLTNKVLSKKTKEAKH